MTPRRCPHYAEIVRLLEIAPCCSWRLFASGTGAERWRSAQRWIIRGHHAATLLPEGCDPLSLRWPAGTCIADVSGQGAEIVRALAQALVRDGVTHALLVDLENPARTLHVKPQPQRVAA